MTFTLTHTDTTNQIGKNGTSVLSGSHQLNNAEKCLHLFSIDIHIYMCVKCNMDLKLIYSNSTEIKSLAKDAKYCKQNKLHKYLLPEIMVESKYVKAMKMREKARALAISFRM